MILPCPVSVESTIEILHPTEISQPMTADPADKLVTNSSVEDSVVIVALAIITSVAEIVPLTIKSIAERLFTQRLSIQLITDKLVTTASAAERVPLITTLSLNFADFLTSNLPST